MEQFEDEKIKNEMTDEVETKEIGFSNQEQSEEISFSDLGLDEETLLAIEKKGFKTPSPIQLLAIPRLLAGDSNLIAKARTGTGKTAAFGLPIVQKTRGKSGAVRALVLEPTRELAVQTSEELRSFSSGKGAKVAVLYGGASYREQIRALKSLPEIVVGTPGRVIDHIERGTLSLDKIDFFILDEGDEMLDMGFIDDIKRIFSSANPLARKLLFSATMPREILSIAEEFLGDYEVCEEEGFVEEPLLIEQTYWLVREKDKIEALVRLIDSSEDFFGLVFTQTKIDADEVQRALDFRGFEAAALHGDVAQSQREKILARFRAKKTRVLVATDVAARGIDISGLSHVVNYSLPFDGATYIHRIGRTGRAGESGKAITFVRPEERRRLSFLRSAIRKNAKGEMTFGFPPSIQEVLESKKSRLISSIQEKMESFSESEEFKDFARSLLARFEAEEAIARLSRAFLGDALSPLRYKEMEEIREEKESRKSHSALHGKRLFVGMGKKDGFSARDIASFFSSLLKIPGRQVDDIRVMDSFSLISLPEGAASRVLELSRKNPSLPHIHVDVKGGYKNERGKKSDILRGEGRSAKVRSEKGGRMGKTRPRVHTPTNRNGASAYKKTRPRDEF